MSFNSQSDTLKNNAANFNIFKRFFHRPHCDHCPTKMTQFFLWQGCGKNPGGWGRYAWHGVGTAASRIHHAINIPNDRA